MEDSDAQPAAGRPVGAPTSPLHYPALAPCKPLNRREVLLHQRVLLHFEPESPSQAECTLLWPTKSRGCHPEVAHCDQQGLACAVRALRCTGCVSTGTTVQGLEGRSRRVASCTGTELTQRSGSPRGTASRSRKSSQSRTRSRPCSSWPPAAPSSPSGGSNCWSIRNFFAGIQGRPQSGQAGPPQSRTRLRRSSS